jgi:hypothetical protein
MVSSWQSSETPEAQLRTIGAVLGEDGDPSRERCEA